jgi:hypothetical protein
MKVYAGTINAVKIRVEKKVSKANNEVAAE